jgi:hypothetical protein
MPLVKLSKLTATATLRAKVRAFKALYDTEPKIRVMGRWTGAADGEAVFCNAGCDAMIVGGLVRVDLGHEGSSVLDLADGRHSAVVILSAPDA